MKKYEKKIKKENKKNTLAIAINLLTTKVAIALLIVFSFNHSWAESSIVSNKNISNTTKQEAQLSQKVQKIVMVGAESDSFSPEDLDSDFSVDEESSQKIASIDSEAMKRFVNAGESIESHKKSKAHKKSLKISFE